MTPDAPQSRPVALVTGGARGIGRAITRTLASSGSLVVFSYRTRTDAAEKLVREIREDGGQAFAVQADAADPSSTEALVRSVLEQQGRLDVVVANAGYVGPDWARISLEQWERVLRTDLFGPFALIRAAGPGLRASRGCAVVVGSIAGLVAFPEGPAYATAKAGALHLVRDLALALAPEVRVNGVAPGWVRTDMTEALSSEPMEQRRLGIHIPLKRWGTPEDVAHAVQFLVSDGARFITGATLVIDGGGLLSSSVMRGPGD